jgi:hypothetical protein
MRNNATETSIDDDWSIWKNTVMTAVHNCIPTKYVDPRRSPPWITLPTILHQIRKKATARKKFLHKGTDYLKENLDYEARLKKLYKKAESRSSHPWAAF